MLLYEAIVVRIQLCPSIRLLVLRETLGLSLVHEAVLQGLLLMFLQDRLQRCLVERDFCNILVLPCKHHLSLLSDLLTASSQVLLQFFDAVRISESVEGVLTAGCRW